MHKDSQEAGTLLPLSAISAELLNEVAKQQIENDENYSQDNPPPEWPRLARMAKEASEMEEFNSLIQCFCNVIDEQGTKQAGGQVLKLLAMGWRMAEIHLQQSLEKSAN